jgi:hypothetical protein
MSPWRTVLFFEGFSPRRGREAIVNYDRNDLIGVSIVKLQSFFAIEHVLETYFLLMAASKRRIFPLAGLDGG